MNINPIYENPEVVKKICAFFEQEGYIQFQEFLQEKEVKKIKELLSKQSFTKIYDPLLASKEILSLSELYVPEVVAFVEFFSSKTFIDYLEHILGFSLRVKNIGLEKFGHKDFELLSDLKKSDDELQVIFDISDEWEKKQGGTLVYTTKTEEILYLEPLFNTLSIVYKPAEVMTYLKYINSKAQKKNIMRIKVSFDLVEDLS